MRSVIILGSSRSHGHTGQIIDIFLKTHQADVIDLNQLTIGFYDYEHRNRADDFWPTMKLMVEYDLVVLATPVYWYSMSGILKVFLDRITDCLKNDREIIHKLKGKSLAVISCGSEEIATEGFFIPFRKTAEYLGMNYLGDLYTWIEVSTPNDKVIQAITEFSLKLKK